MISAIQKPKLNKKSNLYTIVNKFHEINGSFQQFFNALFTIFINLLTST